MQPRPPWTKKAHQPPGGHTGNCETKPRPIPPGLGEVVSRFPINPRVEGPFGLKSRGGIPSRKGGGPPSPSQRQSGYDGGRPPPSSFITQPRREFHRWFSTTAVIRPGGWGLGAKPGKSVFGRIEKTPGIGPSGTTWATPTQNLTGWTTKMIGFRGSFFSGRAGLRSHTLQFLRVPVSIGRTKARPGGKPPRQKKPWGTTQGPGRPAKPVLEPRGHGAPTRPRSEPPQAKRFFDQFVARRIFFSSRESPPGGSWPNFQTPGAPAPLFPSFSCIGLRGPIQKTGWSRLQPTPPPRAPFLGAVGFTFDRPIHGPSDTFFKTGLAY